LKVYSSDFTNVDLLYNAPSSESETVTTTTSEENNDEGETTDTGTPVEARDLHAPEIHLQVLYETAMMLRTKVKSHPGLQVEWPPNADDFCPSEIEKVIPVEVYNLLAWSTRLTDEVIGDKFVNLNSDAHRKLVSIAQDLLALATDAKFMPKRLGLALTVMHRTGSTRLVSLLNKLGHTVSVSTLKRFETALANLQLKDEDGLPEPLRVGMPTILIADNIDFSEETMTGMGTTHHTNVIAVQVTPGSTDEATISRRKENIDKRARTPRNH
jgi:hypothetical protein